jgi:isochorismate synthase
VTRPATTPAAGFRDALEGLTREVQTSAPGRLHLATCRLPPETDPLRLWRAASPDVFAAFWEADGETVAGLGRTPEAPADGKGAAGRVAEPRAGADEPRRFGSVPFASGWTDDDWRPLTATGFVLPRWSVTRSAPGEPVTVTLAVRATGDPVDRSELSSEFGRILAKLTGAEDVGGMPDGRERERERATRTTAGFEAPRTDDRETWDAAVGEALAAIEDGELAKVVLARRVAAPRPAGVDGAEVLERLRAEGSGQFRFGLRAGGRSFVGASPECLFRKHGPDVEVEALAGTYDLGTERTLVDAAEHLFASGKDLEEHALVVRGVVEALAPLSDSVAPEEWPQVREARRLAHLSTRVRARVEPSVAPRALIEALHPTPAVGGLPREAALAFIRRVEAAPRGLYAAPVGWISASGDACLAVGIRSALLLESHAWVYAGAGIVAASDPSSEWDETAAKLRWFGELTGHGGAA